MANSNRNSAAKAVHIQRVAQALELRRAGKSYPEIGAALGVAQSHAHRLVAEGMEDARAQVTTEATQLRAEELSRLDAMMQGLWPSARKGGVTAVDRVLKIMERRARLLGLDAPVRSALEGGPPGSPPIQSVGMTLDEFQAMAAEIAGKV